MAALGHWTDLAHAREGGAARGLWLQILNMYIWR